MESAVEKPWPNVIIAAAEGDSESSSNPTDAVLFVGISLVLGIASRHVLRGTRVPYTVALLVLGIAMGSIGLCNFVNLRDSVLKLVCFSYNDSAKENDLSSLLVYMWSN